MKKANGKEIVKQKSKFINNNNNNNDDSCSSDEDERIDKAKRESRLYSQIARNNVGTTSSSSSRSDGGSGCSTSSSCGGSSSSVGGSSSVGVVSVVNDEVEVEPRYPKREGTARVNYTEMETPDDDHFLCKLLIVMLKRYNN